MRAGLLIRFVAAWIGSIVVIVGPYFAIVYGLPALFDRMGIAEHAVGSAELIDKLNPPYWIAMAVYLAISFLITPSVDTENLGLGGTLWNNPFSLEDDRNRALLGIGLILAPGKIVAYALRLTWFMIRGGGQ